MVSELRGHIAKRIDYECGIVLKCQMLKGKRCY